MQERYVQHLILVRDNKHCSADCAHFKLRERGPGGGTACRLFAAYLEEDTCRKHHGHYFRCTKCRGLEFGETKKEGKLEIYHEDKEFELARWDNELTIKISQADEHGGQTVVTVKYHTPDDDLVIVTRSFALLETAFVWAASLTPKQLTPKEAKNAYKLEWMFGNENGQIYERQDGTEVSIVGMGDKFGAELKESGNYLLHSFHSKDSALHFAATMELPDV